MYDESRPFPASGKTSATWKLQALDALPALAALPREGTRRHPKLEQNYTSCGKLGTHLNVHKKGSCIAGGLSTARAIGVLHDSPEQEKGVSI